MYKVTLEINSSIYSHIMFFLENLPKNLLNIKQEVQTKKELPKGFLNPIEVQGYKNIASRDEIYQRGSIAKMKSLQGVGKELYQGIDSDAYIKELRNEW